MTDINQGKDGYDCERKNITISTNNEDVPQDGASLSHEKQTEKRAPQNTQISPHAQDRLPSQSHQTFCSDFPSTQGLTGNTRSDEIEHASQSFPAPPGIKSSSSEASSQNNVRPDSVKPQSTEEHVEMEENTSSSGPNPTNKLKAEAPTNDCSSPRPDNKLPSVQCALSDSANQPQIKEQNNNKSTPSANEATCMVSISQAQCSTAGVLPPSGDQNNEGPDIRSHEDLVKAQTESLTQQSSVPLQPLKSDSGESSKKETHTMHHSNGQGEEQQNPSNRKVFGPHNNEV